MLVPSRPGGLLPALLLLLWVPGAAAASLCDETQGGCSEPASVRPDPAILSTVRDEPPHRVRRHYLWSNERRHDLFFDDIRGIGGAFIGVGADQNYTLAAVARAEAVWLIDIDQVVVHLHQLYAALIAASPTAEELLGHFMDGRLRHVRGALLAHHDDAKRRAAALSVYEEHRAALHEHLRRTHHSGSPRGQPNWLRSPELYTFVRGLVLARRMVPRLCDLNGPSCMREIGAATAAAGLNVRAIYLSNAESWSRYSKRFADNLAALPFDERSLVLRTVKSKILRYPSGDSWHFSIQGGRDFVDKLAQRLYRSVDRMMADLLLEDSRADTSTRRGLSRIEPGACTTLREVPLGLVTRPPASPALAGSH